jgi:hypothetical protein
VVIRKTPFQSFRLDLDDVADCIALIHAGTNTRHAIARELGMGEKKVEGIFEWAEFLGLLEDRPRTKAQVLKPIGRKLLEFPRFPGSIQALEILYAMIVINHPLVNQVVNRFAYSKSRQFDPTFSKEAFKQALLNIGQGFDVDPQFLSKRAYIYRDLLSNSSHFGKLGIFVETGDEIFRINSYRPDWRSAAYILYDSWPENTSRMRIGEVVTGRNRLGRIFFLSEPQVMALLSRLEQERAIALEVVADLRQIGLNPSMRAEDFLEMLIHDQS